jgi:hypothetical protein
MFKEFVHILLRMDSRVFKKYKKFPVGDLYKVKIQISERNGVILLHKFQFLGQYKIHPDQWVYIVSFDEQKYLHLHFF